MGFGKGLILVPLLLCFCSGYGSPKTGKSIQTLKEEFPNMMGMLDAMNQLMTGSNEGYDPQFITKLMDCMVTLDDQLPASQDAAWKGMVDYSDSNGTPEDVWGESSGGDKGDGDEYVLGDFNLKWHEKNRTEQDYHNVSICEPCNYASNMAYYHVVPQICQMSEQWTIDDASIRGLAQGFSALGMGSSFAHGSSTHMGYMCDVRFIDVIAYVTHQACVANLDTNSSVIHDLSETPRASTGVIETQKLTDMFREVPVYQWNETVPFLDIPQYEFSFAGIVGSYMTLLYDDPLADLIIDALLNILPVKDEEKVFILERLVPELREALGHIELSEEEVAELTGNGITAFTKLIYAFLWQEEVIDYEALIFNPIFNVIGSTLLKYVNQFADDHSTYPEYDMEMQDGDHAYPGSEWCNPRDPHAKWHVESANGLMALVNLADNMNRFITKNKPLR